jgi:hypothetical protein
MTPIFLNASGKPGIQNGAARRRPLFRSSPIILVDQKLSSVENCEPENDETDLSRMDDFESYYYRVEISWNGQRHISVIGSFPLTVNESMHEICGSAQLIEFRRLRNPCLAPVHGVRFEDLFRMALVITF